MFQKKINFIIKYNEATYLAEKITYTFEMFQTKQGISDKKSKLQEILF